MSVQYRSFKHFNSIILQQVALEMVLTLVKCTEGDKQLTGSMHSNTRRISPTLPCFARSRSSCPLRKRISESSGLLSLNFVKRSISCWSVSCLEKIKDFIFTFFRFFLIGLGYPVFGMGLGFSIVGSYKERFQFSARGWDTIMIIWGHYMIKRFQDYSFKAKKSRKFCCCGLNGFRGTYDSRSRSYLLKSSVSPALNLSEFH